METSNPKYIPIHVGTGTVYITEDSLKEWTDVLGVPGDSCYTLTKEEVKGLLNVDDEQTSLNQQKN